MIALEEKLYTSEETAQVLGVTPRTLYRYVKNGEITPETKTRSGTYRFLREEIYRYLYPEKHEQVLEQVKAMEQESANTSRFGNEVLNTPQNTQVQHMSQHKPAQSSTNHPKPNTKVGDDVVTEASSMQKPKLPEDSAPLKNTPPSPPKEEEEIDLNAELKNLEENLARAENAKPQEELNKPGNNPAPAQSSTSVDLLNDVEESLDVVSPKQTDSSIAPTEAPDNSEEPWNYYVNDKFGLLEIAKKLNELSKETGRKYAATMQGGLSLHHDIDEFFTVHFYVENDDLNWWVQQLELTPTDKEGANICLIPSQNTNLFKDAYKLRGLFVVPDQKLIEDLMKHGEKELAKTLV